MQLDQDDGSTRDARLEERDGLVLVVQIAHVVDADGRKLRIEGGRDRGHREDVRVAVSQEEDAPRSAIV
jgi:hypothetical protein